MNQLLRKIRDDCKILQHRWKANSQRKEITQPLLITSLKRKRNDLRTNPEQKIPMLMILRNQRLTTTEAILMIIEQNQILNSLVIQQIHELQTQHSLFILIGTKLSYTSYIENVTIRLNLQISASKTTESSILMKICLLNHES